MHTSISKLLTQGCGDVEQRCLIGRQCVILQQLLGIRLDHALRPRPRLQRAEMAGGGEVISAGRDSGGASGICKLPSAQRRMCNWEAI